VRSFFRQGEGGSSDADVRTEEEQKTSDFSKFLVCLHGQEGRGLEPVRTFFGQGGMKCQFFAILCGRLLWTAPNDEAIIVLHKQIISIYFLKITVDRNFRKLFITLFQ